MIFTDTSGGKRTDRSNDKLMHSSSWNKNSRKLAVSKKGLDTLVTFATMCTYEADNPKCRGFEARTNLWALKRRAEPVAQPATF
jgi:hypothetical protein